MLESYGFALNRTLVNEDEPAHMPRRRLLMDPFNRGRLAHHEPLVRRLAREFVDRFVVDGRADLADQMLYEIPLTVALHFLGVPEDDMDTLRKYSVAHQTVLEALREADVEVPNDCEEGLCGTCQIGVLDGEIDHRDVVLTKDERAGNAMLTCCSRARGGRLGLDL